MEMFAQDIFMSGGLAYVAGGTPGLLILDVSDPANPIKMGSLDMPASKVIVSRELAYIIGLGGLRVVDVSDPTPPIEVGFLETPGVARALSISDGLAYIAMAPPA